MRALLLIAIAATAGLNCCGYSTRSLLPPHLRTVAVPPIENATMQPGLGEALTDLLSDAFSRDRTLRVTTLDNADLVVAASVTGYTRTAAVYDEEQTISRYEVIVSARVEAEDRVRSESFFTGTVTERTSYDPEAETEEAAADQALKKLAEEVVRRVLTAW